MKLPNGQRAIIDRRKLDDYCLSPAHRDGRNKARVFGATVGLDRKNVDMLIRALRVAAEQGDAVEGGEDDYGSRYTVDFSFDGPLGSATVRSAWMIRTGERRV